MGRPLRVDGLRARLYQWPPLQLVRLGCEPASGCVVLRACLPIVDSTSQEVSLALHRLGCPRDFCDVAIYQDGTVRSAGRVASSPEQLALFA